MRALPRRIRDSWVVFLTAALVFAVADTADAQRIRRPPKSDFHVGQKVTFDFMGKSRSGEVTGIEMTGWVKVHFQDDGNDRDWTFPPDQVRAVKPPPAAKTPMRTWSDSSGQFKLDARFVSLKDGKVTLQKADRSMKTLPLDKLSDEDQQEAKKWAAKAPAANPFEGSDNAQSPADAPADEKSDEKPANDDEIIAPAGDWSSVQDVVVDISSRGEFAPDAAGGTLAQFRTVTMDLTKGAKDRDFMWERPAGLFLDRSRQRLIAATTNEQAGGGHRSARLEACDMRTGRSLGAVVLETGSVPLDISPDGSSVVCVPTQLVSAFHKRRGIEVWRMQGGGKLVKRWNPNDNRGKEEMFKVDRAKFISPDLLLTVNTMGGKATAWDVEHARAVYTLAIDTNSRPALSVNRKQLAAVCSGAVCVFDAATGQTLLTLTGGGGRKGGANMRGGTAMRIGASLAFRPDGCQLAVVDNECLQIWDLQKQAVAQQMWLSQEQMRNGSGTVDWVDDNHLLVNGADLVDIAKRIVLWHYEVPGNARSACAVIDGHLAFGSSQNERGRGGMQAAIYFLSLPHPEVAQVAAGLTEEKLTALEAGTQVSLDLRFPTTDPQEMDAITASYTEQLKSYNVLVVTGAPLAFQASVEPGKTESKTYRTMGHFGEETVNVTSQKCRLALMENGKVLWERSAEFTGAGFMLSRKEGETLQAAVERASQQSVVNFFRNISLPGYVARQGEHGAYGFSKVTPLGLVAYDPTAEPATPPRGRLRR